MFQLPAVACFFAFERDNFISLSDYEAIRKSISFRKQDIKGILKPMK